MFVGDHFTSRAICWHSWEAHNESTRKLEVLAGVQWVFPGHGKRFPVSPGNFPTKIRQRVRKMASQA